MSKKPHHDPRGPVTGDDFVEIAKKRGATVQEGAKDGFTKISTPAGSMYIAPGKDRLDAGTISNTKKWFRILGLMIFLLLCVWPILSRVIFSAMS